MGKDGVGLRLTFPTSTVVHTITLDTPTPGGTLRVLDGDGEPSSTAPALWEGTMETPTTTITLPTDAAHDSLILWWTELPPGDESAENPHWARLGEVTVMGVANS